MILAWVWIELSRSSCGFALKASCLRGLASRAGHSPKLPTSHLRHVTKSNPNPPFISNHSCPQKQKQKKKSRSRNRNRAISFLFLCLPLGDRNLQKLNGGFDSFCIQSHSWVQEWETSGWSLELVVQRVADFSFVYPFTRRLGEDPSFGFSAVYVGLWYEFWFFGIFFCCPDHEIVWSSIPNSSSGC